MQDFWPKFRILTLSWLFLSWLLFACGEPTPTLAPATLSPAEQAAKIDSLLRDLLVRYQTGGLNAAREYAQATGLLDDQDRVRFGLTLASAAAAPSLSSQVVKMGGQVYATSEDRLAVAIGLTSLTNYYNNTDKRNFFQELASFKEVREIKILLKPPQNSVNLEVQNEGLRVTGADKWQKAGFRGKNVKVGVIDGGFVGWRNFLGNALPPASQVQFKSFLLGDGEGNGSHGVAVAEVVHEVAPEAALLLAAIEDEIGFTRAVQYFIEQKVQIIQISLGWAGIFPGDGTSKMAAKLDEARRLGILPVVSSGNYGQAHWRGTFKPNANGLHQFFPDRLTLKLTAQSSAPWVALRWQEPWNAARTNLDLYILDSTGNPIISSRNEQGSNQSPKPPSELAPFRANTGQTYYIQVKLADNSPAPANLSFDLFAYNAELENATAEGSIATPGDARGAISVGAADWKTGNLEPYSSQGLTSDGRLKPDFLAPTNVSSEVSKPIFNGTSAAAPQVAGLAALIWSAATDLTADQVAVYLSRNAQDYGAPGRDLQSGYGRVQLGEVEAARLGSAELLGAIPDPDGAPFLDNFKSKSSGLPNNNLGYYGTENLPGVGENPAYFVSLPTGQLNWNVYSNRSFEEFRADVVIIPPLLPDIFYGLVFWQQDKENYYTWLLSGSRYALLKRNGAHWQTLIDWSQDAALREAGNNYRVSLEATSFYLRLRVGDTILQRITLRPNSGTPPPTKLGGSFGFVAGSFGMNSSTSAVAFKDLTLIPLTTRLN